MRGNDAAGHGHEQLLSQREWIRGLARVLAADGAAADDLEQETVTAALRSPPPGGGFPRAWLAAVMRNFARRSGRTAGRVRRREEAAARPEAVDDAADVVARAEAHRRVVDAVLSLPEPARAAVLLRFFDGLPPREVARRTGVPVETARTRLKRALAELRERLGGERGREGLLGLLVPLLGREESAATTAAVGGTVAVGATIAVAAGSVALAAGGIVAMNAAGGGDEAPPPVLTATVAPTPPLPQHPPAGPLPEGSKSPAAPAPLPASPPAAASAAPAAKPRLSDEEIHAWKIDLLEFREPTSFAAALDITARKVEIGVEYDAPSLKEHCEREKVPCLQLRNVPFKDAVDLLVTQVRSPEPKKGVILWRLRDGALFVHVGRPPPPSPEQVREAEERQALDAQLRTVVPEWDFDVGTAAAAVEDLARRIDRTPEYASEEIAQHFRGVTLPIRKRLRDNSVASLIRIVVDAVPWPDPARRLQWNVRGKSLRILLVDRPTLEEDAATVAARKEAESARLLRGRLFDEKSSLEFDGCTLEEALRRLGKEHGVEVVLEEESATRARAVVVKLALQDARLLDALNELLRPAPDLRWEVRGSAVVVRKP